MNKINKQKQKKIKHKLILHNTNLKKDDISDRIITISAPQRTGKSSFIVGFIHQFFKYQNKYRFKETNEFIDMLNGIKVDRKTVYRLSKNSHGHYIFTSENFPFILDKKFKYKTIEINPKRLGMPNEKKQFIHIPYGSIIIVDEADKYWPNRDWQSTPSEFIEFLKYIGHNHLTLILITQVYGNLDKKIRELSMEHYHILGRVIKPKRWWFREKFIWYYDITYPQEILRYQDFKDLGMDVPSPQVTHCKFVYKDNPHKYYNSKSGLPLFLYNIEDYTYLPHPFSDKLDPVSVSKVARKSNEDILKANFEEEFDMYKFVEKRVKLKKLKSELKEEVEKYLDEIK